MRFSDELHVFLGQLHQDPHLMGDATVWLSDILVGMGRSRSKKLAAFLDDLLSQPYDFADLERQWTASGAEFWLANRAQIPAFLAMVRDFARTERVLSSGIS
jgi:hypothetical protein